MSMKRRFRALAVLYEELLKLPHYDREAERLYRRLRRGSGELREQLRGTAPATARRAPISAFRRTAAEG